MPFKLLLHDGGQTGLAAICDVCGERVEGAHANILWKSTPSWDEGPGHSYDYIIACKVDCTWKHRLECQSEGASQFSTCLDTGLWYLTHNARVNMREAKRKAIALSSM